MNKLATLMQLAEMVSDDTAAKPQPSVDGWAIVIADRGHVWVGDCRIGPEWVEIAGARCVRRWGTTQGLAELAAKGPLAETKLDAAATVRVARKAVIALIPTEATRWA